MSQSLDIPQPNQDFSHLHEAEVWKDLKAGNKNAFSFFYTRYLKVLYNYGMKVRRDSALIEDCIQDLFAGIWNSHERLGDVTNVKSYLFKSLRTKIIYKLSLLSRTPMKDIESFSFSLSHTAHYITQRENADVSEKIRQFIDTLSPKQKEAIFLIYYEELSYEEAATIMDLKVKTVYNLVHLAIANLRQNKGRIAPSVLFSFL
ncbi:RNA polymerase sigma factor [Chryseolinea sp. T2]|uniref:RNA polymerase sigma factor n=1 Tax=Chryseolinea sp. T2 TaxID=3129255 RepID=UPI003076CC1B